MYVWGGVFNRSAFGLNSAFFYFVFFTTNHEPGVFYCLFTKIKSWLKGSYLFLGCQREV